MIAPAMLSSAVAELLTPPRLEWREDGEHGVTGIATGSDSQVREDVWEWALAFGLTPRVVEPEPVHPGWRTLSPGVIFVELPVVGVEITVAGRLTELPRPVKTAAREDAEDKAALAAKRKANAGVLR